MTDGAGTEARTHDAFNRLTAVIRGTNTFSYGYDAASNLTSRNYPGQAAQSLTYDDGRLTGANGATYGYNRALTRHSRSARSGKPSSATPATSRVRMATSTALAIQPSGKYGPITR